MSLKILVADDENSIQSLLKKALGDSSYDLLSATDGVEAVRLARAQRPDLILLDINMPGKNGREVLKDLRENTDTQLIPVIFRRATITWTTRWPASTWAPTTTSR